jgi:chorismate mutase
MDKNSVEKLRKEVDAVDRRLVSLLAERFNITKEIISLKKENGLPAKDESREGEIVKKASELAEKSGISSKFMADIFKIILRESKR